MFEKSRRGNNGFTLVEILVVIAIIGILAAIAIPAYSKHIDKTRITAAVSTLDTVRKELESYYNTHDKYPAAINFATGMDDSGKVVFSPELVKEIQTTFFTINSYVPATNDYNLIAQANNSSHTVITMTASQTDY